MRIAFLLLLAAMTTGLAAEPSGVRFDLAIVPIVLPSDAILCELVDGRLSVTKGEKKVFEKAISGKELAKFTAVFSAADPEKWAGFYFNDHVLDGEWIQFHATSDKGDFKFRGSNGCPSGFAKFVEVVNLVVGHAIIDGDWDAAGTGARRFEDKGDFMTSLEAAMEQLMKEIRDSVEE